MQTAYNDSMFEFVISWFFVFLEGLQVYAALGKLSKIEYKTACNHICSFFNGG